MYKTGVFLFKLGILITGAAVIIIIATLILGIFLGGGTFFLALLIGPVIHFSLLAGVPIALLGALIEKFTKPIEIKIARESKITHKRGYGLKVFIITIGVLFVGSSYKLFNHASYGRDDQNLQIISIVLMCTGFVLVGYGFIKSPTIKS